MGGLSKVLDCLQRAADGCCSLLKTTSISHVGGLTESGLCTEGLCQVIRNGEVVAEEVHRRSPATGSYTQVQARALFASAGFGHVELCSQFTFEPVKPDDRLFMVVAREATQVDRRLMLWLLRCTPTGAPQ